MAKIGRKSKYIQYHDEIVEIMANYYSYNSICREIARRHPEDFIGITGLIAYMKSAGLTIVKPAVERDCFYCDLFEECDKKVCQFDDDDLREYERIKQLPYMNFPDEGANDLE